MRSRREGQATVEYIVMLGVAVVVGILLYRGLLASTRKLHAKMVCEISAPCPGCKTPDSVNNAVGQYTSRGTGATPVVCK